MKAHLILLAVLIFGTIQVQGADVVTATDADFSDIISKGEIALVKFYAPWCGHCKKLAPEWEKAANEVPDQAVLVDVDCTKETALAKKYEIKGYPTIILFRDGEQVETYSGPRQSEEIVKYVAGNVGPAAIYPSSADELTKLREENNVVCITVTSNGDSDLSKIVVASAQKLRSKIKFAIVTDPTIAPNQKPETVVVYRKADEDTEEYKGKMQVIDLEAFLRTAVLPFAGEISPQTYKDYAESTKPAGWVFLKPSDEASTHFKTQLGEMGKKLREQVVTLWVDVDQYAGVTKHLGLADDAKFPAFVIAQGEKHYIHPSTEPATVDSIERFVNDFASGKLTASVKSQPVPEVETLDGLTTIVGKTMGTYLSSGKDILIEFYAPWCGHCQKLAPIYAKVAKEFESSDVVIAAMDATENDVDSSLFEVTGFPTLYFVPHGQEPILFEGDRTFYEIYKFVREHGSAFKGQPIPTQPSLEGENTNNAKEDSKEPPSDNDNGDL